jgi:plasmid stabilization system protein ParE
MPQGDKSAYTNKQKRRAEHIEEGYEQRGISRKKAARRAWATVNKEDGGGKKRGSGRGKKPNRSPSRKGGRKSAASQSHATRVRAGKKAARTRAKR